MIPEAKLEAVKKALQKAFNTKTVESIILMNGGYSGALLYKITVSGKPYVLGLVRQIDAFNDPVRQYACMNIAAEAGIAPHVYYSNAQDAVSITDFIETTPLLEHFTSSNELLPELVKTIQSIHSTPLFPKLVNYLDGRDFHQQVSTGNVSLTTHEGQLLYGKVRLNEALYNMKTPRFADSIDLMK